jgi:hypothetical protein
LKAVVEKHQQKLSSCLETSAEVKEVVTETQEKLKLKQKRIESKNCKANFAQLKEEVLQRLTID